MFDRAETKTAPAVDNAARIALHEDSMKPADKVTDTQSTPVTPTSKDVGKDTTLDPAPPPGRWTLDHASQWYQNQGWIVGSNFLPSNSINQLEMWQKETFDPKEIDRELGWAQNLGMNTMRVFLQDQLWTSDPEGFKSRIDQFLTIAASHHIKPVFVLFDSCWDPNPKLGKQRDPVPGVHNSGWVQSPGRAELTDKSQYGKLEKYVEGVVGAFGKDDRVLAWDVWNEPDNMNDAAYKKQEPPNKVALIQDLLPKVFSWARSENPIQPLTSGIWNGDWSSYNRMSTIQKTQLQDSDVISYHNYGTPQDFEQRINWLSVYDRPIICTEYMARPIGSTFDPMMQIAKKDHVGVMNWGFVAGKSQTYLPWDSWQKPYPEPYKNQWFHDIFNADGSPYDAKEVDFIKRMTGVDSSKSK